MSVQAMSHVIDNSQHKGSSLLCLLMIANHADRFGYNTFPSYGTLAQECRMSKRQMIRTVKLLIQSGELRLKARGGPGKSNSFQVVMDGSDKMSLGDSDKKSLGKKRHGDIGDIRVVTSTTKHGDTAMSPEPSLTVLEPEEEEGEEKHPLHLPVDKFSEKDGWPEDDPWLKPYLETAALPFGLLREYVLTPRWWRGVSLACGGLSQAFLDSVFGALDAAIVGGSAPKPKNRGEWEKALRAWLVQENRIRQEWRQKVR